MTLSIITAAVVGGSCGIALLIALFFFCKRFLWRTRSQVLELAEIVQQAQPTLSEYSEHYATLSCDSAGKYEDSAEILEWLRDGNHDAQDVRHSVHRSGHRSRHQDANQDENWIRAQYSARLDANRARARYETAHADSARRNVQVGATLPRNIRVGEWAKIDALMFTMELAPQIDVAHVAAAGGAVADGALVDIEVRCISGECDVQPPDRRDIKWFASFVLQESFHVRLRTDAATLQFSFLASENGVGIGSIMLALNSRTKIEVANTSDALSTFLLHAATDLDVARSVMESLHTFGVKLVSDIESAAVVQVLWSPMCAELVASSRETLVANLSRVRVIYWDPADVACIPDFLRGVPTTYFHNSIADVSRELRGLRQDTAATHALLKQCVSLLETNYRAICAAAISDCPKLFHVWPARVSGAGRLRPSNWAAHKFKLHLICEGASEYTPDRGHGPHYVFDMHPGYEIARPREWFVKWGPIIAAATKLLCAAGKITVTVFGLGSLADLVPDGIPVDAIARAEEIVGAGISGFRGEDTDLREMIVQRAQDAVAAMESVVDSPDLADCADGDAGAAFSALRSFLRGRTPEPEYGGLVQRFHTPGMPNAGEAVWVCPAHAALIDKKNFGHVVTDI